MNHTTRNGLLTHCFVWFLDFFAAILEATENGPKSFQQVNTNKRSSRNLSKRFSDNLPGIFCLFEYNITSRIFLSSYKILETSFF